MIDAFVVLGGGGMKGIALAGCLKALEDLKVTPLGFGGTSAGALVALLASAGYGADELRGVFIEQDYQEFFDDRGRRLEDFIRFAERCNGVPSLIGQALSSPRLLYRLITKKGLYDGRPLERYVDEKLIKKLKETHPRLPIPHVITFGFLRDVVKCKPLKIVSSNLESRAAQVHAGLGNRNEFDGPVAVAVRASMNYPFAFEPVQHGSHWWVDGGVASNVPSFLFKTDAQRVSAPTIAFDLIQEAPSRAREDTMKSYCGAMLETALQSGDALFRAAVDGIIYVPIVVPATAGALQINLTRKQRDDLFDTGRSQTWDYFRGAYPAWSAVKTPPEQLQVARNVPASQGEALLKAAAAEFASRMAVKDVRAHVTLPTTKDTRIVAYHHGMSFHQDHKIVLAMNEGSSAHTYSTGDPVAAPIDWRLTEPNRKLLPAEPRWALNVPIFSRGANAPKSASTAYGSAVFGVLTLDTTSALDEKWVTRYRREVAELARLWGGLFSRVLE